MSDGITGPVCSTEHPRSKLFRLLPTEVQTGRVVVDGGSEVCGGWTPRTMFLSVGGNVPYSTDFSAVTPKLDTEQQYITFLLEGLHYGAPFRRYFTLFSGTQVRIPLTFDGVRLTIEGIQPDNAGTPNSPVECILTDQEVNSAERSPYLWMATAVTAAGSYLVPPGARRMVPAVADAGFAWGTAGPFGKLATIPQGQAAGVPVDVVGTLYNVTNPAFSAAWLIEV